MNKKIYKDEDSQTIYEYLKEFDAETERRKAFSSALKRKLLEAHYAKEDAERYKKELDAYKNNIREKE